MTRAVEHIEHINSDISANSAVYAPKNAIRYKIYTDPSGTGQREWVFYLRGSAPVLPLPLTVWAGEAVHQLRTVLDHLAYQLVVAYTKQPPKFNSAFPIVGKGKMTKKRGWISAADVYADQISNLRNNVSIDAEALIYGLQPCQLGDSYHDDPLWVLSELDNAYKHRLLAVIAHKIKHYAVRITGDGVDLALTFDPNMLFENGAEIGRALIPSAISAADPKVGMNGKVLFAIAFKQVANRANVGVLECLIDLRTHVERIVDDASKLPELA
jgi:hypothetical protein